MPFIKRGPLNYPINSESSIRVFEANRAPTTADFRNFTVSDEWWDTSSNDFWKLVFKDSTQGIWRKMAGTAGAVEFFTPDVGGQVGPDATNNINLLGGGGITVTGTPAANTLTIAPSGGGSLIETLTGDAGGAVGPSAGGNINFLGNTGAFANGIQFTGTPLNNTLTAMDLRNITVYVVDAVAGQTEYQTVQAALNAANAAGGGTVYVRPGTYTENLTLYDAVDITAAVATPAGFQTTIIGSHTPPAAGAVSLRNLSLSDTTNILNSAVAGTTTIVIIDCVTDVANGYTFQLANWTGLIAFINSHCIGTQDGFADIGAGGADFLGISSTLGVGATNIMALGGNNRINNCNINCSMDWVGTASGIIRASQLTNTWLVSDNAACVMTDTLFITDASLTFLNHTSNGNVTLSNVTISTDQDPNVITGTGTILFGSVVFVLNSDINAGITKQSVGSVETGPIHIGSGATDITNHIDIVETVVGDDVIALLNNVDNTNAASDTQVDLIVGGTSAGDPFIHFDITGSSEKSIGFDNSDSDIFKITTGATPSAGTTHWAMTTAGERTMALQPAFLATNNADQDNVTGDNTSYLVNYNTEVFDQNADYNNGTYTFAAPVTGRYCLASFIGSHDYAAGHTEYAHRIVTSNRTFTLIALNAFACIQIGSPIELATGSSVFADMDAADTATVSLTVGNAAKVIDIDAGWAAASSLSFSGYLEC